MLKGVFQSMAQRDTNPYKFSDSNKRYMTYDWYLKERFSGKIAKIPLDIGCTCPNLDGVRGCGGCIYCSNGSAAGIIPDTDDIILQYNRGRDVMRRKWEAVGYIPYFQSNTNTYGELEFLERCYNTAAELDGAVMLDIATRADCLGDDVIDALGRVAERIPLLVELGLQTSSDSTAERINRCHTFAEFCEGYARLKELGKRLDEKFSAESFIHKRLTVGVHIINGLPDEGRDEMLRTARDVAALEPDIVKIHLMHVIRGTRLGEMYLRGEYKPLSREEYVGIVCDQLEVLPEECVIGRVTGDGIASELLAPEWSRRKTEVVNEIDKEMYRRQTYQGRLCGK